MTDDAVVVRPTLKPWLTWTTTEEQLIVSHGSSITVFEGEVATSLLPALFPMLDGSLVIDEIAEAIGSDLRPAIDRAMAELEERDLLLAEDDDVAGFDTTPTALAAAQMVAGGLADGRPLDIVKRLAAAQVTIAGSGLIASEIVRWLRIFGVGQVHLATASDIDLPANALVVAVSGPGDQSNLSRWNDEALRRQQTWMAVMAYDGRFASIGPVFVPGQTACFECFQIRRASNLAFRVEQRVVDKTNGSERSGGGVVGGPIAATTAALAAEAVFSTLIAKAEDPSMLTGRVLTLASSISGTTTAMHRLYRVPRCPVCSPTKGLGHPQVWFDPEPDEQTQASAVVPAHECTSDACRC